MFCDFATLSESFGDSGQFGIFMHVPKYQGQNSSISKKVRICSGTLLQFHPFDSSIFFGVPIIISPLNEGREDTSSRWSSEQKTKTRPSLREVYANAPELLRRPELGLDPVQHAKLAAVSGDAVLPCSQQR